MFDKKLLNYVINTALSARNDLHCELQELNAFSKKDDDKFCEETEKIKELQKYLNEKDFILKDDYLLLAADFENYKRRNTIAIEQAKNVEKRNLALKFLDTYDSMERMLKHIDKFDSNETISRECSGFNMIVENFVKALESEGFTKIDCNCGDKFDVNYHEALATRDIQANENYKPDDIVEIYQSGWLLNGDLVRPTKVVVGK